MAESLKVPFNRVEVSARVKEYIAESLSRGGLGGDGVNTKRCEQILESLFPGARVLLTSSCTHALEMSALLLGIKPGDEVIVPSFTFSSTANAFALRGAKLVFADIRADTLNIDESHLESLITARTKALVVVHYAGVACEMESILATTGDHDIAVIEDNAHGFLGSWHGQPLGTLTPMSALSFHESKNITCGEGGALVINDRAYSDRAEIIREKGTDRSRFFRGLIDKYSWVDIGSSYVMSDVLAGCLLGNIEDREEIQRLRQSVWERYSVELRSWATENGVQLPKVPVGAEQPAHLFYVVMPNEHDRDRFISHMKERGVGTAFHYQPLHRSKMAIDSGWASNECPITDRISGRLVRLPVYPSLTLAELNHVLEATVAFCAG